MGEKLFWLGIMGALILGVAVFGIVSFFKSKAPEAPTEIKPPAGGTTIISDGETKGLVVRYSGSAFSPGKILVKQNEAGEVCAVTVINLGPRELVIRLNPHSPQDDVGFPYQPIPPGQSIILDPRYRQESIAFHNHQNPGEEFQVELGPGCKLL